MKQSSSRPIRYGKPCMTNLPPKLGRRIFKAILNTPPFDYTELDRQCARLERQFAKIAAEIASHETARK